MMPNLHPGMNSTATSTAVPASELLLGSDAGLLINDISTVMADERLAPSDNLTHFGLGSC